MRPARPRMWRIADRPGPSAATWGRGVRERRLWTESGHRGQPAESADQPGDHRHDADEQERGEQAQPERDGRADADPAGLVLHLRAGPGGELVAQPLQGLGDGLAGPGRAGERAAERRQGGHGCRAIPRPRRASPRGRCAAAAPRARRRPAPGRASQTTASAVGGRQPAADRGREQADDVRQVRSDPLAPPPLRRCLGPSEHHPHDGAGHQAHGQPRPPRDEAPGAEPGQPAPQPPPRTLVVVTVDGRRGRRGRVGRRTAGGTASQAAAPASPATRSTGVTGRPRPRSARSRRGRRTRAAARRPGRRGRRVCRAGSRPGRRPSPRRSPAPRRGAPPTSRAVARAEASSPWTTRSVAAAWRSDSASRVSASARPCPVRCATCQAAATSARPSRAGSRGEDPEGGGYVAAQGRRVGDRRQRRPGLRRAGQRGPGRLPGRQLGGQEVARLQHPVAAWRPAPAPRADRATAGGPPRRPRRRGAPGPSAAGLRPACREHPRTHRPGAGTSRRDAGRREPGPAPAA